MSELRIYMAGPTSLPTAGFASAGLASLGLTAHDIDPRVFAAAGNSLLSAVARQATAVTPSQSSGFYAGVVTTDVPWPTGMGWTAGSTDTIRANIQALYNSSGNGNGPIGGGQTHFVRHLPAAGAVYDIGVGALNLTGRQYVITDGGGAGLEVGSNVTVGGVTRFRLTNAGHLGGATIKGAGNPNASPSHTGSVFLTRGLSSTPSATELRWRGLTIEGSSTNYATTSAGNGGEKQHCIVLGGVDGAWIDHCILQRNKGDGVYITDSHLGNQSAYRSRNIRITHNYLRQNGRMLIALIWAEGLYIEDNLFSDACYAHIDVEPNLNWQLSKDIRVARNTFLDWGWDPDFFGSCFMTTTPQATPDISGFIDIIDNVVVGVSKTTGRPAEWNADFIFTPYTAFTKTALTTISGNISLRQKAGPAVYLSRNTGGAIITNNKGFLSSGSFVGSRPDIGPGGPVTQSGNT